MDTRQLVTIAVTAIITAFVKEIAGWLLSIAKNFAINTTIKAKIKKAFTLNKITAVVNFVIMAFCLSEVYRAVYSSEPVDRFTILKIAFYTCAGFANLLRLEIQLALHTEHMKQLRREEQIAAQELQIAKQRAESLKPLFEKADQLIASTRRSLSEDKEVKSLPYKAKPLPPDDVQQ